MDVIYSTTAATNARAMDYKAAADRPFHGGRVVNLASDKILDTTRSGSPRIASKHVFGPHPRDSSQICWIYLKVRRAPVRRQSAFHRSSSNRLLLRRQLQSAAAENRQVSHSDTYRRLYLLAFIFLDIDSTVSDNCI